MSQENIGEKNQHTARNNGVSTGLAYLNGAALYEVTIKGRHTGNDKGEEKRLDNAHPEIPLREVVLHTRREVGRSDDVAQVGRSVGPDHAGRNTEGHQEGNHRHQGGNLGQNQVRGRVDTHYLERIDLLRHPHRTQFGSNV